LGEGIKTGKNKGTDLAALHQAVAVYEEEEEGS